MRAGLCLLLVACGGAPRWTTRSPDGAHSAEVVDDARGVTLRVDAEEHGPFEAIALDAWTWTGDAPVVPVRTRRGWHLWSAGRLGPPHRAIGHVDPARDLYAALEDDGWHLVVRGEAGPAHEAIVAGSVRVSEDHVAYVARDDDGARAVVDGRRGEAHRRVDRLDFAGKQGLAVYVTYDEAAHLVAGRESHGPFDAVHELVRAPREPRWAAIVERDRELALVRDGDGSGLPRGARSLALSANGVRIGWVAPDGEGEAVWIDGSRIATHAAVRELRFVAGTHAPLWVAASERGLRAVHDGSAGPRFDELELATGAAGRWGYVGRRVAGSAVVVDGELVFRGEWASAPQLGRDGWACVVRQAGARYVLTPSGRARVPRPFVDTLVLDPTGEHWAVAVADEERHALRVYVDGEDAAPFSIEALATRPDLAAARAQVAAVLAGSR